MELVEVQVDVDNLQPGMYVSRLDRDWLGTGFPLQGFLVRDAADIARLRAVSRQVYVDMVQSGREVRATLQTLQARQRPPSAFGVGDAAPRGAAAMKSELPQARAAVRGLSALAASMMERLRRDEVIAREEIAQAVEPIVRSVVRQPEAAFWLLTLQRHESRMYRHAVNCAALAALLGRQLQMPEQVLVSLATGGLLFDLGLTRMPEHLRDQAELSVAQRAASDPGHVVRGLEMYRNVSGGSDEIVDEMLRYHHERIDGSGYPLAMSGNAIPLPARIAAIIDVYDDLVTVAPQRDALSQHDALQTLYRGRDRLFQAELVEQFMQAMSIYPVGSLVELSSGEVAIVMSQNPARRLRPTLMLLTDATKGLLGHFRELDLMVADRAGLPESGLSIVRGLPVGAYGLDPTELYL